MSIKLLVLACVLFAACGGDKDKAGAPASEPALPAGLTPEMQQLLEGYVVAFETLMSELGGAADCKSALAVIERNGTQLDALEAGKDQLRADLAAVRERDVEALTAWSAKTYESRIKTAMLKAAPIRATCDENDPELRAAMGTIMPRYPMMRPKKK